MLFMHDKLGDGIRSHADLNSQLLVLSFQNQIRANRQHIHARAFEAIDGFRRLADDGFILVETGVQNDRNSGLCARMPEIKS